MKKLPYTPLYAALLSLGLGVSYPAFGGGSSLPDEPQAQSPATQSVQSEVDDKVTDKADAKRKKILADAGTAIEATEAALQSLDENNTEAALQSLEKATGKLELILAREPELSLAPVDVDVATYDLMASLDTVKAVIEDAEDFLEDGRIQEARPLVANLASEIVIRTTSIPLATYPDAIRAITPLIDEGKIDEARAELRAALNTLVVTDEIYPLPILRAEQLLDNAEALAEDEERTIKDNETLADLLADARKQLKMAELLGYGTEETFKPMYEQLDQIGDKTTGGEGGKGWFDKIKAQLSEML
ncbi:MAG: YfdX family protein [Gammaproteobacteria bacterium]